MAQPNEKSPFRAEPLVYRVGFFEAARFRWSVGTLPAKDVELLSIAFDASYTHMYYAHMYAPGTRRHTRNALKAGATMEEIMEVVKLCAVQGAEALNLGVPILAEELARQRASGD